MLPKFRKYTKYHTAVNVRNTISLIKDWDETFSKSNLQSCIRLHNIFKYFDDWKVLQSTSLAGCLFICHKRLTTVHPDLHRPNNICCVDYLRIKGLWTICAQHKPDSESYDEAGTSCYLCSCADRDCENHIQRSDHDYRTWSICRLFAIPIRVFYQFNRSRALQMNERFAHSLTPNYCILRGSLDRAWLYKSLSIPRRRQIYSECFFWGWGC